MSQLWLLKGSRDAPGWKPLEQDSKEEKVDLVIFDRSAFAVILAEDPPSQYEGLVCSEPPNGMYVSEQGYPIYVFDNHELSGPRELLEAIGGEAMEMLEKTGDADTALQRLGLAF